MAEIKSALDKALERAKKIGQATAEEMKENLYLEAGRRLAARYLQEEDMELAAALAQEPAGVRPFLLKGIEETILRNIVLPREEDMEKNIKKAMQGILILKSNSTQARKILAQMEDLFRQYKQTILHAREQLKARLGMKFGTLQKQMEQKLHSKINIDIERQPQFQEEWLQISIEINAQFNHFLEQQKGLLRAV